MATSLISDLGYSEFADTTARIFYGGPDLMQVNDLAEVQSLYMVESVPKAAGAQKVYDEIDMDTYAKYKAEGANVSKAQTIAGYSKTMYRYRFGIEIDITYEARNDGKEQQIIRKLTNLATYCPNRLAIDLSHRFSYATATSYRDMDGRTVDTSMGDTYAAAYATHALTGTTDTYSTVITGNPVGGAGGLDVARNLANTQIKNNFGDQRVMNFDTVVCFNDSATIREFKQLQNSTADPAGLNSGVYNVDKNSFRLVVLPRGATSATGAYDSTKLKYWFFIASGQLEFHLGIWEAPNLKQPAAGNNGENLHNDDWTFGARCGYGIVGVSAKGLFHSTGVGA